jgi:hypothetical protein
MGPLLIKPAEMMLFYTGADNYSIFRYLVRAIEGMERTPPACMEDTFYLLDSCCDNVLHFFESTNKIAYDLGGPASFLPAQKNRLPDFFKEIEDYRNTMLHNPLIGRVLGETGEFVPKREFLLHPSTSIRGRLNQFGNRLKAARYV